MNIFLSQPMSGLTDDQIRYNRNLGINRLAQYMRNIPSHWPQEWKNPDNWHVLANMNFEQLSHPLMYLGKDIAMMADAQLLFAIKGWEKARGCRVELKVAEEYGLYIIYEDRVGDVVYQDQTHMITI